MSGMLLSLLAVADAATLTRWFDALAADGRVITPLEQCPWGDIGGTVVYHYGIRWLIGFRPEG
ncbi:hypothetical protein [Microbacterium sp.]|uniref:hypothetical protein n=1 Tax=Microbacterium sp. TaxID=51671 RepID=UPI0039E7208D